MPATSSSSSTNSNTAPGLEIAAILGAIWSFLTYVVRVWAKVLKCDGWHGDDTAITLSAVALLANMIATCLAVHDRYGSAWSSLSDENRTPAIKSIYAAQILYVLSLGFAKASTSHFASRVLAQSERRKQVTRGLTLLSIVWTVVSTIVIAVRGRGSAPWKTLDGTAAMYHRWLGIEISGYLIDLAVATLSNYFVWGLNMSIQKRLAVCLIFTSRLLVGPIVGLRLWELSPSRNKNSNIPNTMADVFTEVEMALGFMLVSITCLKPFLRPFQSDYMIDSSDSNAYSGYDRRPKGFVQSSSVVETSSKTDASNEKSADEGILLTLQESLKSGREIKTTRKSSLALRPDVCEYEVSARAEKASADVSKDGMMVSKTQAWNVSYQ